MTTRRPLYYTFGNHMHWVDMQWLWGYDVLPGSVRDMLHLCRETGAKGCVNFDGIGYEKMAAECPEALAELREAVRAGTIEPVGCSYGQPYGLFQGGESNVRQFTYGVRSVRRLLGVRPKTFWEEEFYFFPQLPQVLTSCGFTGANLFFQWTWHTPEVPKEAASLILWEGADGTRIPTLPRNALNVHQWPEDFDGLLEQGLINELEAPAIVQWLELMPSKDWMCRSEVLLPRLKELFADPRFDLRPGTCAEIIASLMEPARMESGQMEPDAQARVKEPVAQARATLPTRRYTMDQVWHGMLLGKNGDKHPRTSRHVEQELIAAEAHSALAGLFGRPYASWDVYPTWELDEAWRELLSAQHHDNHECEGLCGATGYHSFERASSLAREVLGRTWNRLSNPDTEHLGNVCFNALGWARPYREFERRPRIPGEPPNEWPSVCRSAGIVPPFGFASTRVIDTGEGETQVVAEESATTFRLSRSGLSVVVDKASGGIVELSGSGRSGGQYSVDAPLIEYEGAFAGTRIKLRPDREPMLLKEQGRIAVWLSQGLDKGSITLDISLHPILDAVCLIVTDRWGHEPDAGLNQALVAIVRHGDSNAVLRTDTPFGVEEVRPSGTFKRKYPTGDWMTSPQWFESIERPFTSSSFVDVIDPVSGGGLLVAHDCSQQFLRRDDGIAMVVTATDPWDEGKADTPIDSFGSMWLMPHGDLADVDRIKSAMTVVPNPAFGVWHGGPVSPEVPRFGALEVTNAPNVLAHAFYRDSMKSGEHLPDWAGHRMARESSGACTHPFVVRLVEWNGAPAEVALKLPGPVALAAKTNLMGECGAWSAGWKARPPGSRDSAPADAPAHLRDTGWLTVEPTTPPDWAKDAHFRGRPIPWSLVRFTMRPREIATVMADLVMGRKEFRDLDAKREVWATVHRVDG